jgi:hypothetical protein
VCPTPHSPFAPQLPSSFLNSILLPICIELRYIAGPLPSTLLLAISQGTWNHDHQLQHHSAPAAGSSEFAPKSTTQPRGESAPFFLSSGPFLLPNDLCGNSDRWATSAGQNGRTPKASEDQGRQVYSFLSRLFLIFLQCSRIFCCQKTTSPDSLDTSPLSRPAQLFRLPRGFLSRVVIHALPMALSCDLPTRDRISSKAPAKYGLW